MFTRPIFIRPDSELIRESVCACAKLFVDEGNVHMAQVESWKNKNIDGFYAKTTQKGGFSKLCGKIKKRCYTDLLHFSTRKHNYTPRKHRLGGGGVNRNRSVCLSGPTSTSFLWFPPSFVEFKIMMCELCSIKDFIVHWVLPLYASLNLEILRQFSMHFVIANSPTWLIRSSWNFVHCKILIWRCAH
jgi:hypothetical protein